MKALLPLLLPLALCACPGLQQRCRSAQGNDGPWQVCEAFAATVDTECRGGEDMQRDDGKPMQHSFIGTQCSYGSCRSVLIAGDSSGGCVKWADKTVWIPFGASWAVWRHEWCHIETGASLEARAYCEREYH